MKLLTTKTDKIVRKFFEEEWNDDKIKLHSQCVIDACLDMAKNTNLRKEVFIVAGWIHDLGRNVNADKHHKLSVNYFHKFLKKHPEFENIKTEVIDCILNHRSKGKPKTAYGVIFRAADKIALKDRRWLN